MVLEQLDRVLDDVTERLDRRDCRHDNDVAGRGLQRANHAVHLPGAFRIDDPREVVHWLSELGERVRGTEGRERKDEGHNDECRDMADG